MKAMLLTLLALALVDWSSAQARFYVMYKMFSSKDTFCGGSFQNVYNSDLNEARIDGKDNSISSAQCYKNSVGQYISRTCDSTSEVTSLATFSNPGCSGVPDSVSNVSANGFCVFWNDPPLIYMGCTSNEEAAKSKGYQDVNKIFAWILVS
jgi:hypothetical protein